MIRIYDVPADSFENSDSDNSDIETETDSD